MTVKQIQRKIDSLQSHLRDLEKDLADAKRRGYLECYKCRKRTKLSRLVYLRTHEYEPPRSCSDGDFWYEGTGMYECPKCNHLHLLSIVKETNLYFDPRKDAFVRHVLSLKDFFGAIQDVYHR